MVVILSLIRATAIRFSLELLMKKGVKPNKADFKAALGEIIKALEMQ